MKPVIVTAVSVGKCAAMTGRLEERALVLQRFREAYTDVAQGMIINLSVQLSVVHLRMRRLDYLLLFYILYFPLLKLLLHLCWSCCLVIVIPPYFLCLQ